MTKKRNPEEAAEEILVDIDRHPLSSSRVSRSATREFLEVIKGGLETRLYALRQDVQRKAGEAEDD